MKTRTSPVRLIPTMTELRYVPLISILGRADQLMKRSDLVVMTFDEIAELRTINDELERRKAYNDH